MNDFSSKLYSELMELTKLLSGVFYIVTQNIDNIHYRVFTYRLASYKEFTLPSALECRGIMFRMLDDETPAELVSIPFQKFFNVNENPFTQNLDYSKTVQVEEKADGFMLASYNHLGTMRIKSKTSVNSMMSNVAETYLNSASGEKLKAAIEYYHTAGYTVIGEWCDKTDPDNGILSTYDKPHIKIFGVRRLKDGFILDYRNHNEPLLGSDAIAYQHAKDVLVANSVVTYDVDDLAEFDSRAIEEIGLEGYVYVFSDGSRVKRKTDWFFKHHKILQKNATSKELFLASTQGRSDDLKSLFFGNNHILNLIDEMDEFTKPHIIDIKKIVEGFYVQNSSLSKKDYCIKANRELCKAHCYLAIEMYKESGNEPDYAKYFMKNRKEFLEEFENGKK